MTYQRIHDRFVDGIPGQRCDSPARGQALLPYLINNADSTSDSLVSTAENCILSCTWSLKICIKQLPHQNASLGRHKKLIDYKLHVLFCSL